ncbi:restriction endonuclease subunit S [Micromonospora sp. NPDC048868]|uniref:restriction endonuclease subunit S n=1 Tax=Micromonospora sp. NPDC048868 TaxID=3364258 RepID=UPI00371CB10F
MTYPFEIPPSWTWTTLGEIAEVVGGVTKDTKRQADPSYVEVPYLRVANVQRGYLDLSNVSRIRVPEHKAEALRLQRGDVLLNEGGDRDKLGRGWIWEGQIPGCIHQNHVFRARIIGGVLAPKLLALFANSFGRKWFQQNGLQSVNLASISLTTMKRFPVPVPPLAEQHRIIAVLDGHLSQLAVGERHIERVGHRLARLMEAFTGALDAELSSRPSVRLGELLASPLRNGHSASADSDGSVRTLTLTAVTRGEFTDRFTKMTSADPGRVRDLWLQPGDILIQRSNTPDLVGTAAIYEGPSGWAIYPDLLIRVRLQDKALPRFVTLLLQTPRARRYFKSLAKGLAGSMPKIDQRAIAEFPLALPELDRQAGIVRRADGLMKYVKRVEAASAGAAKRSGQLRASLLAEAFAGRLVPQDNNDEPASELLARIRAERQAAQPKQKARSPRTRKELAAPPTRVTGDDYRQETLPL